MTSSPSPTLRALCAGVVNRDLPGRPAPSGGQVSLTFGCRVWTTRPIGMGELYLHMMEQRRVFAQLSKHRKIWKRR